MLNSADFYEKNKGELGKSSSNLWIQTYKGTKFYMDDPKFDIDEIAHALSLQCRFTGHIKEFYSVAEHSVMVGGLAANLGGDAFEGLLHDAHEAYISDIASPWKQLLPDYKKIEKAVEASMREHFLLKPVISETVKLADWIALFIEANSLMVGDTKDWTAPSGVKEKAQKFIDDQYAPMCWTPREAERYFMEAYEHLRPKLAA